MRSRFCWLLLALSSLGCSWSRFDDVVEDSPIVLLNRPKSISGGFGSSLAAGTEKGEAILLVGGAPLRSGAAEFNLRGADSPTLDARDQGHCMGSEAPCYHTNSPVALTGADSPGSGEPRELCFVNGVGTASDETGVVVRCTDDVEYALEIPDKANKLLTFSINNAQPTLFRFGADHGDGPALLATADEESAVWYYPPLTRRPFVDILNPADAAGRWETNQARILSVARVGERRLLAVGIPSESAVRLFRADGPAVDYVGCLGGTPGFGRAITTGRVLADEDDELVIADDEVVYVLDAAQLATLEPTASSDCSLGALPAGSLITSFTCGSTKNISGCAASDFGAALGVGDLDGDGDGEVVVGAPKMTVRHVDGAGAVIIYDVEPPENGAVDELFRFKDIAFLSSADEDDRLGSSLALPAIEGRQVLAAGAPGGGKTALFYCPSFLPDELKGPRCQPK